MAIAKTSQYLGDIYYHDADGSDVSCRGAVWCASRDDFDVEVSKHLKPQGASFLWSEEVHEALGWFNKFGNNGLMAGLAKKVNNANPVALSDPKVSYDEANDEDESYLIIEEIEGVEPLDMQMGTYPKLTVPTALQEAMFGQPEPTEAEIEQYGDDVPPMNTYAILDAAKMPYLLTGALSQSGLDYQSLFQGEAQDEFGEYAPYIVKLEDGNDFTRKLFTNFKPPLGLWQQELGIFVRSRASLFELRNHFRKFTKVQDEKGKWYYFRFWDSQVIINYLVSVRKDNEKFNWFFNTRFGDIYILGNNGSNFYSIKNGTLAQKTISKIVFDRDIYRVLSIPILNRFRDRLVEYVTNKSIVKGFNFLPKKIYEKSTRVVDFIHNKRAFEDVSLRHYSMLVMMFLLLDDVKSETAILSGEVLNNTQIRMQNRIEITVTSYMNALRRVHGKEVI